jgi:hypothetical protein
MMISLQRNCGKKVPEATDKTYRSGGDGGWLPNQWGYSSKGPVRFNSSHYNAGYL